MHIHDPWQSGRGGCERRACHAQLRVQRHVYIDIMHTCICTYTTCGKVAGGDVKDAGVTLNSESNAIASDQIGDERLVPYRVCGCGGLHV